MAAPIRLRVNLLAPDGSRAAARGLAGWLARTAPASARGEVTVALVSDQRMRSLNRMFRGKDYATDVLSFGVGNRPTSARSSQASSGEVSPEPLDPGRGESGEPGTRERKGRGREFGDIVIATGVATRQAREHGHPVGTELRVLALHGLLHMLGYDHEVDAGRMARAEARLRKKGGLPAGLIGRAKNRP